SSDTSHESVTTTALSGSRPQDLRQSRRIVIPPVDFALSSKTFTPTAGERGDDFIGDHNGTGVVWDIDVEGGVHLLLRETRGRVFYQRDLVAQLSGKANSGLHARIGSEADDDELMKAMLFELQIQIGVGKATGTPMLEGHDIACLRFEFAADLATPRALCKGLSHPGCLLDRRYVLPGLVVARTVAMMDGIENPELRLPRSMQDLQHMRNTIICFCHTLHALP